MSTNSHRARLTPAQFQPPAANPRMQERRLLVAFMGMLTGPRPAPSHRWDDCGRREPRMPLPFAREREMIRAAIEQGCTTPERVIEYYLVRVEDALALFPDAGDYSARELVRSKLAIDEVTAIDAQLTDLAQPSPEHHRAALEATERVAIDCRLFLAQG